MTTENEFIRKLALQFPVLDPVEVGIGDDGAVLHSTSSRLVFVTDMLLDGVHFDLSRTTPELCGRKSIAVNLSDLAAMACRPTAAFISIAVPKSLNDSAGFLSELYRGIGDLAEEYRFTIAGGDTNSWDGPFVINVGLTGQPMGERPILRSGGMAGDALFVTGPLGGSLIRDRHLRFAPRLDLAEWLTRHVGIHAMIDLSDGLSIDLHRLAAASHCAAMLKAAEIPIHSDVSPSLSPEQRLHAALSDGEDFELLFAVSQEDSRKLRSDLMLQAGRSLYEIGRLEGGSGCRIQDAQGAESLIEITGWQHALP